MKPYELDLAPIGEVIATRISEEDGEITPERLADRTAAVKMRGPWWSVTGVSRPVDTQELLFISPADTWEKVG